MGADASAAPSPLIVSIVGTRPEAIKMAPVLRAIAARGLAQKLLLTGQHQDLAPHFGFLRDGDCVALGVDPRGRSLDGLAASIRDAIHAELARDRPALVLVQGDTISALAGALAAQTCGVPVGHVEAGLRSFDLRQPFPEEAIRRRIDALATLLFAPTEQAAANLEADRTVRGTIFVTGNSGIDALLAARDADAAHPAADESEPRRTILVTCHRRENQGAPMDAVAAALVRLVAALPVRVVLPLHPNRHVRAAIEARLAGRPHILLVAPAPHAAMVALIDRAWLILTDSGGLQEEGPALGTPVLVLRDVTERPEAGANVALVGTDPDTIVATVRDLLGDPARYARMATPSFPFGDGKAGPRIADAIVEWLKERGAEVGEGAARSETFE